jgi:hypothetical protein
MEEVLGYFNVLLLDFVVRTKATHCISQFG